MAVAVGAVGGMHVMCGSAKSIINGQIFQYSNPAQSQLTLNC